MEHKRISDLQTSYDRIAEEYVQRIFDELKHKPLDRQLLDRFADRLRGAGPVCDLGCGPGHVTRYLRERGVEVFGIDLSTAMVEQARKLNPGIEFIQGNMFSLGVEDGAWSGIVAFYSIIHTPGVEMLSSLLEMNRVLQPGGLLLLAFHNGKDTIHMEEWWGHKVSLDTFFFPPIEIEGYLDSAGFQVEETIERPPYENVEYPSNRAYIFAGKSVEI
jgi:SAM-dependent methyltransferase